MPTFRHDGHELHYEVHGDGERPLVMLHGLLMSGRMFERFAPAVAECGNTVILLDLLGHGRSERPPETLHYSSDRFAGQVAGVLDHLGYEQAVIGGTSLGANVTLSVAKHHPDRVRAMVVEMPVLDNALLPAAVIFTPMLFALRFGRPAFSAISALTRRIPRTTFLADIVLDWLRQDPEPSAAVLEGLFLGGGAPHHDDRIRMNQPALVIGHRADPLHPFSDSGMLVDELPNARMVTARSPLEWRIAPTRLNGELTGFLDEVWSTGTRHPPDEPAAQPAQSEAARSRAAPDRGPAKSAGA